MIETAGGTFNREDKNIYFIASGTGRLECAEDVNDHILIAVNELSSEIDMIRLERWFSQGKKIFIDSGVFWLTNEHMRKHHISMDAALALAPEEIDGFGELFEKYVALVRKYEDQCWGYIELDQGGRENKIKTRAKLEKLGLRPIPVYHPLNDGWDYFDYLAERYDRICFGNVVQADRNTRLRLVATAWERHKKYPNLWIHLLGLTPNEWLNAFPSNSCDSSSWLVNVRWAASWKPFVGTKTHGVFPLNFRYSYGSNPDSPEGANTAVKLSAYQYQFLEKNWQNHIRAMEQIGFPIYPKEVAYE